MVLVRDQQRYLEAVQQAFDSPFPREAFRADLDKFAAEARFALRPFRSALETWRRSWRSAVRDGLVLVRQATGNSRVESTPAPHELRSGGYRSAWISCRCGGVRCDHRPFLARPMGVAESVGEGLTEVVRVIRASGLPNETNTLFTTIEGEMRKICGP